MIDEDGFDPRWQGAFIGSSHWHFHSQLLKRYRIVLGPGDFSKIVLALKHGTAIFIEQRIGKTAIYSVRIGSAGERIYVLAKGTSIITAWPPAKRLNEIRRQRSIAANAPADASPG